MTKKLNWRLKTLPTADEVASLVEQKVITANEAKDLLFTESDDKDPTVSELKRQIEFLEGLVTELSKKPRDSAYIYKWIDTRTPLLPTTVWCSSGTLGKSSTSASASYATNLISM